MLCNKGHLFFVKSTGKVVMHTMQAQGRGELQHYLFLTLTLGGSEWSSSHSSHFTPKEGVLCTLWILGWGVSLNMIHIIMVTIIECAAENECVGVVVNAM